jgi:hypothetical protein
MVKHIVCLREFVNLQMSWSSKSHSERGLDGRLAIGAKISKTNIKPYHNIKLLPCPCETTSETYIFLMDKTWQEGTTDFQIEYMKVLLPRHAHAGLGRDDTASCPNRTPQIIC